MSVSVLESLVGCKLSGLDRRIIARRASKLGKGERALSESNISGASAALLASALEYREEMDSPDERALETFVNRFRRKDDRNTFARKIGVQIRRERRRQIA